LAVIRFHNLIYHKLKKLGLVIAARELLEIIEEKYEQNQDGRLLVALMKKAP